MTAIPIATGTAVSAKDSAMNVAGPSAVIAASSRQMAITGGMHAAAKVSHGICSRSMPLAARIRARSAGADDTIPARDPTIPKTNSGTTTSSGTAGIGLSTFSNGTL